MKNVVEFIFFDQSVNSCTGYNEEVQTQLQNKISPLRNGGCFKLKSNITMFKLSASVAAIMLIYAFGGLRCGFSLKHLSLCQAQHLQS